MSYSRFDAPADTILATVEKRWEKQDMTFGQRLRELRIMAGLSQEALARAANLSLSAFSKLERTGIDPSWSTVQKICRALGVSASAFEVPEEEAEPAVEEQARPKRKPKGK